MTFQLKNKPDASAYSYGLRLLSFHGYSEAALVEKLLKAQYVEAEIQSAMEKLKSYGFINDRDLAMSYFRNYFSSGKTGFYLIREKLNKRGFPPEIVTECLRNYDYDLAEDQAIKLAKSHFANQLQAKPKIFRYLAARGFPGETIRKAIQRLNCE